MDEPDIPDPDCPTLLKACPFCGHRAEQDEAEDGGGYIHCTRCDASTALHYDRRENLIPSWNERVSDSALERERDTIGSRARAFAEHYPHGSDGRNTFILFAEWVESRS